MSSEERDIILQMVAENKITTAEAADLLDALNEVETEERESSSAPNWGGLHETIDSALGEAGLHISEKVRERARRHADREARQWQREAQQRARDAARDFRRGRNGRSLLIHVSDGEETRTHVHIPLGLAIAAGKFIPKKARVYFDEYGIDLTDLVDTITHDLARVGEIINIRDGETRVQVTVIGSDTPVPMPPTPPLAPAPPIPPTPPTPPAPPAPSESAPSESV